VIEGYRGAHDLQRLVHRLVEEHGGHGLVAVLLSRASLVPEEKRIDAPRLLMLSAETAVESGGASRTVDVRSQTLDEWIALPREERLGWLPLHATVAFVESVSAL